MRYENLSYEQKQKLFQRLHKRLNKNLFEGKLKKVNIYESNLNKKVGEAFLGMYSCFDYGGASIRFSYELADDIAKCKTIREQVHMLAETMLHEMVHQYCHENGINDENHNDAFIEAEDAHGMVGMRTASGELRDFLSPDSEWILDSFRMR